MNGKAKKKRGMDSDDDYEPKCDELNFKTPSKEKRKKKQTSQSSAAKETNQVSSGDEPDLTKCTPSRTSSCMYCAKIIIRILLILISVRPVYNGEPMGETKLVQVQSHASMKGGIHCDMPSNFL